MAISTEIQRQQCLQLPLSGRPVGVAEQHHYQQMLPRSLQPIVYDQIGPRSYLMHAHMLCVGLRLPLPCTMQRTFSAIKVMASSAAWVASEGVGHSSVTAHCQAEAAHRAINRV
jgi:hypothetical protein